MHPIALAAGSVRYNGVDIPQYMDDDGVHKSLMGFHREQPVYEEQYVHKVDLIPHDVPQEFDAVVNQRGLTIYVDCWGDTNVARAIDSFVATQPSGVEFLDVIVTQRVVCKIYFDDLRSPRDITFKLLMLETA
jgi:hypothetical protein